MNKVILIGNLTKDPEITTTNSGISVTRFSIAVGRKFTNQNGEREVDFFNIVAWRGLADTCHKYLKKGNKCCVVGNIQNRSYEQDGIKRIFTEITAEDIEFLSPKSEASEGSFEPKSNEVSDLEQIDDDNLPF